MTYILTAGVAPQWLAEQAAKGIDVGPRNESQKIAASIQKMQEDLKQFNNLVLEGIMLRPGEDGSWQDFFALLKKRRWDGVTLGGGVRTTPFLSDYFTELIAATTREQPQATLLFPLLPEDIAPAIKKHMPTVD